MHPMEEYTMACLNVLVEYCKLFDKTKCRGCIFFREIRSGDKETISCVVCERLNKAMGNEPEEEDT